MAPQGSGWELGGAASQTSLKVAPGEPGIDVTSPGVLEIGGDVATSVELGPSGVLVDAAGKATRNGASSGWYIQILDWVLTRTDV